MSDRFQRVLVTAFEPFSGSRSNPTVELAALLKRSFPSLHTATLPVVGGTSTGGAWHTLQARHHGPWDVVVHLGEAQTRATVTIERIAINLRDGAVADNAGVVVTDTPVVGGGPDAYFTTLLVDAMLSAARGCGVAVGQSLSAGSFLCNELMYRSLHHARTMGLNTRVGFIHVPQSPEQAAARGGSSMEPATALRAIAPMLSAVVPQTS